MARLPHRTDPPVTRRFLVTGRVQGVYYRQSTRLEAERTGLGGSARNLPDGSVEVLVHGPADAVERLRAWLHRGPAQARVAEVRELDVEPEHRPSGGRFLVE